MIEKEATKPVQTRLPSKLIDHLDQQAADRKQTRSDRIAELVRLGLETEILKEVAGEIGTHHTDQMELLGIIHDRLAERDEGQIMDMLALIIERLGKLTK